MTIEFGIAIVLLMAFICLIYGIADYEEEKSAEEEAKAVIDLMNHYFNKEEKNQ